MTSFDEEYREICGDDFSEEPPEKEQTNLCSHSEIDERICMLCGCEVEVLDFRPEWTFYGVFDNKLTKDPARCYMVAKSKSNLDKIFSDYKLGSFFTDKIKLQTLERYKEIAGDGTYRGITKRSIVAACLLYVLRENGDHRTSEEIRTLLVLDKKDMSKGRKKYCEVFSNSRGQDNTKPTVLIRRTMKKVGLGSEHYEKIKQLTLVLEDTSHSLTRSTPQAVVSAIIYFYLNLVDSLRGKFCNKSYFKKVGISEITIIKLMKEITTLVNQSLNDA